ncbi:ParB/RepB/Spo0J family partition protein [Sphingobium yanoikuyae]|jgi:ParB family chromosome partitioning protein|uniref:ParB/RepB/Spo0J family partition protein n=1 Tax=Sphingobium yanoikuyae TaxID=13690 RepID=A0A3G2UKE3_SPHYA|nr:ParB/RepB/Spo0J family partition protein [Sphingobium yanoikuyae]AYO75453.1 ParB/RepB/Spo0J family partition protein [Sphingobium yanoikuyae]
MSKGKFSDIVLARASENAATRTQDDSASEVENPAAAILANRESALSSIASDKAVHTPLLRVDPAKCRVWAHHNRDDRFLNEETCRDLIDAIKADGQQRMPAIVRRLRDDPEGYEFEIIAGRRRHWSVSYLRSKDYTNIDFLISVQSLTDQEAFRVADSENRARKDLTDIERARDYLFGLNEFFAGNQREMADRIGVSTSWLSRYLALARFDDAIIEAFYSPSDIGIAYASKLGPALNDETKRPFIMNQAAKLKAIHEEVRKTAGTPMSAKAVLHQLLASSTSKKATEQTEPVVFNAPSGKPFMMVKAKANGELSIKVHPNTGVTRKEMLEAFAKALDDI